MSAFDDQSSESGSASDPRIEEVADQYLKLLQEGSTTDPQPLIDQHPDLAPALENRLRLMNTLFLAARRERWTSSEAQQAPTSPSADAPSATPEGPMGQTVALAVQPGSHAKRIRCPHCGHQLQVVTVPRQAELTCAGCGSSIQLTVDSTRTRAKQLPWKKIGRFPLQELLGTGGFGSVYKAWDEELARAVAIKIPRSGYFSNTHERLRFLREARSAGQLEHSQIVRIYEVAEHEGVPYIVSEFIEGMTLADLISGHRLSFREAAQTILEVSDAIHHAHQRHIIHRDIKPSNILIDQRGQPFITDFGLAREGDAEIALTLEGEVLGTPAYMSPEQALGQQSKIDARSDVYSLGVILYVLTCGKLPFQGSKRMLIQQLVHEEPRLPRRIDERVPRELETITLKAMAKERSKRYQSAEELAADLRRWLRGEPILAKRTGPAGRFFKWCRRRPLVAALTISICALITLTALLSTTLAIREWQLRAVADDNLQLAEANRIKSNQRLTQLCVQGGIQSMHSNKLLDALVWYTHALDTDIAKARQHRLRIGMLLDNCPRLTGLWDLGSKLNSLHLSGDGTHFAAAGQDGVAKVFALDAAQPVASLSHGEAVYDAQLSGDGQTVATITTQHVHLWNASDSKQVARMAHEGPIAAVKFSPDGNTLVSVAHDHSARIWNRTDGQLLATLSHPGKFVTLATFSPDSTRLLTVSRAHATAPSELRVWDLATYQEQLVVEHAEHIGTAIFDESASRVISGSDDRTVKIWDLTTGKQVGPPLVHDEALLQVFLIDDDRTLVSTTQRGTIARWDLQSGARREKLVHHDVVIAQAALDPLARFVATAGSDGYVRISWLKLETPVCTDLPSGNAASAIAFHPDGRRLVAAGQGGVIRLWDLAGLAPKQPILKHAGPVTQARFSPQGDRVVTASRDDTGRIWNVQDGTPLGPPLQHKGDVLDCQFNRNGRYVATAGDQTARIWDAYTANTFGPTLPHDGLVLRVAFDTRSDRLLTAAAESAQLWNFGSSRPEFTLTHPDQIRSIRFSPAGDRIATASIDGMVRLWQSDDGRAASSPIIHQRPVMNCQFSKSGRWLAMTGGSGANHVLTVADELEHFAELPAESHLGNVAFSHDASLLATADVQGRATICSLNTDGLDVTWQLEHPGFGLRSIDFHPTEPYVAIAAKRFASSDIQPGNGAVFLWDAASGTPLSPPLKHLAEVIRVRFSPTGDTMVSASADHTARLWRLNYDARPLAVLDSLSRTLAGRFLDPRLQLSEVESQTQSAAYRALSAEHAAAFICSAAEIEAWNDYVTWVISQSE